MNKNIMKTFVFMAALGGLFVIVGGSLGGRSGMVIALAFAVLMNMGAYWFSDTLVVKMTRSKPVSEKDAPWLYRIVQPLAQKAGMPMPKLYLMPSAQPNAFATGRNPDRAVVAVTEGILNVLSERELEGVLAHELAHVKNRDILIGAVAATVAAAITMLARLAMWASILGGGGRDRESNSPFGAVGMLLSFILAPIAAMMIQMAVSRSRESQADRTGAELLGDATPLANALIKIDAAAKKMPPMEVNPAVSHVFLQSPFRGQNMTKLFMSHPPLEERIAQLREMGAQV
ncbi:MAG TPA: zinc metalloprotease HtpX [Actinomycetota bacterium]|nr:zinc metalloprotease HtpX [Actinomycetota bacterium]